MRLAPRILACALCLAVQPAFAQSTTVLTGGGFVPGGTVLYSSNFAQTPLGNFPSGLKYLRGNLEVVAVDGVPMLRSSGPSEFLIQLAAPLPNDFTLEFDLQARNSNCCSGEELAFEGGPILNRSSGSAWVAWHHQYTGIIGGGQGLGTSTVTFPEDLQLELIGQRATIQVQMSGTQFKLFTNGRRIYNIPDLVFRRTTSLRIFLGGVNDGDGAVYLARVTLSAGGGAGTVATQQNGLGGGGLAGQSLPGTITQAGSNPAPGTPVTPPTVTPPATGGAANPGPRPVSGTPPVTSQQSSTGSLFPSSIAGVSVGPGSAGPIVTWTAFTAPGNLVVAYTLKRWKIDDPVCCNNASPAGQPLAGPPWQDAPPPLSGTYVYEVTGNTSAGSTSGQTQYVYLKPIAQVASAAPTGGAPGSPLGGTVLGGAPAGRPAPPGGATPLPNPGPGAPPAQPLPSQPKPPGTPTLMNNGPAPTGLVATGTPATATLTWNAVVGAVGYRINRAPAGTTTWTAVTPVPITTTTGPADLLPNPTQTYTYQLQAVQANGHYGEATVEFTAPAAQDPTGLKAIVTAPNGVTLSWNPAPFAATYLVTGPGISNNLQVSGSSFSVTPAPAGENTYRVASVFSPGGVLTGAAAWPSATVTVPPKPIVAMLTLPNGAGSLADYNRHACSTGTWLAAQLAFPGDWCNLPTPYSVADVQPLPIFALFGIQEWFAWNGGPGKEFYDATEWTTHGLSMPPWAFANQRIPEAYFTDQADLDRGRKVGCLLRGQGPAAATLCWAVSWTDPALTTSNQGHGPLSVIIQTARGTSFLMFDEARVNRPGVGAAEPKLVASTTGTFDSQGRRFLPHVCLSCHGGRFDPATGQVTGASLLPLDPRGFWFVGGRSYQEENVRGINQMVFASPSAPGVREYINRMYRGRQLILGAAVDDAYVPPEWSAEPAVYQQIYRPFCAGCHAAQTGPLGFLSWADLLREKVRVKKAICEGTMPHSEVPFWKYWTGSGTVSYSRTLLTALGYPSC